MAALHSSGPVIDVEKDFPLISTFVAGTLPSWLKVIGRTRHVYSCQKKKSINNVITVVIQELEKHWEDHNVVIVDRRTVESRPSTQFSTFNALRHDFCYGKASIQKLLPVKIPTESKKKRLQTWTQKYLEFLSTSHHDLCDIYQKDRNLRDSSQIWLGWKMENKDREFYTQESNRDHGLPFVPFNFQWEDRREAQKEKKLKDDKKLETLRHQFDSASSEIIEEESIEMRTSDNDWKPNHEENFSR